MDETLKIVVRQLKKPSNTTVFNALVSIRTKLIKEEDGVSRFRQYGGLQPLLYHLQRPNFKIVELALSILGNCCLEQETRDAVRRFDGIQHIVKILECIDHVSILNRACRTLANLALDERNAEEIHERSAVKLLIDLLGYAEDHNLKLSALRALRILASKPRHREKVNDLGGTGCLGKILILDGEGNDHCNVLHSVLRGLASLTTECTSECARQMQNVAYLEKLVSCAKDSSVQISETSLHILANLSKQETLRPVLGNTGFVSVLIAQVAKWEKSSSGWQWAVDALCQCTREAINRVRLRNEGGLQHLVSLLKDDEDERLWLCSLSSLVNFLYDDASFEVLVELGLMTALATRFQTLASREARVVHGSSTSPPRLSSTEPQLVLWEQLVSTAWVQGSCSGMSPQSGCFSPDCSPPYWTSFPQMSSPMTSPSARSPRPRFSSTGMRQDPTEEDLRYSPVYEWEDSEDGDVGSRENSSSSKGTEQDSPRIPSSLARSDGPEDDGDDSDHEDTTGDGGRSPLGDILLLFSRLSMQENPGPAFLESGAFVALLRYATEVENPQPRSRRCIFRTVRNALSFEDLVLHRIPSHVHETLVKTPHEATACAACATASNFGQALVTDLRLQAESAFGSGVILHLMLGKSDDKQKLSAAVAAALLLRSPQVRRKVFVDSVGFTPFMNALKSLDVHEEEVKDKDVLMNALKNSNVHEEEVEHNDMSISPLKSHNLQAEEMGKKDMLMTALKSHDALEEEVEDEDIRVEDKDMEKEGNEEVDEAIRGLSYLAKSVLPRTDNNKDDGKQEEEGCDCCYEKVLSDAERGQRVVVLRAGGLGEGIKTCRQLLCSQSEVFNAMFNGYFVEAGNDSVAIEDTTHEALLCMIHFLHGCQTSSCQKLKAARGRVPLLLDILLLADKFLLFKLKDTMAGLITARPCLGNEDFESILSFPRMVAGQVLRRWACAKLLSEDSRRDTQERRRLFSRLVSTDEHLAVDLREFLVAEMTAQT